MDRATFNKFRQIVLETSGIAIGEGKEAMVSARIAKRMRALNITSEREYLRYLTHDKRGDEVIHFLDVISTNVTNFFREPEHFEFLKRSVLGWLKEGQRRFRFWSAGCATGEEAYSMAMTFLEATSGVAGADGKILATDLSTRALAYCHEAVYPAEKVRAIPPELRLRYVEWVHANGERTYRIKDCVRRMLVFRRLNLAETPYPMRGPLDAVFCRNVIIYLDREVTRRMLAEIHRLLKPGGYLFVGHAESLSCLSAGFRVVRPSIHVRADE